MSNPVLFVGLRPLDRSENLNAIFEAYQGEKTFIDKTISPTLFHNLVRSGIYYLMVTDDFTDISPGKVIMVWHGIHGCKTIGLSQPHIPYYNSYIADAMTYIISAGAGEINKLWSRDTGVPLHRIRPLGYAASDLYIGKKKGDGGTFLADYKSFLYAPTFRDTNDGIRHEPDYREIDSMLEDGQLFVVKEHPYYFYQKHQKPVNSGAYKHVVFISPTEPTIPYLIDCDAVVTDYSSIMLEGYLCDKPCVLFHSDDSYLRNRGMCFEYPAVYSQFTARDEMELVTMLNSVAYKDIPDDRKYRAEVREFFASSCDGHSRERICDFIERVNRE